ncbi:hypothetical protein [Deinococcus radiophilus]|uniref:hypothetical protein n=1 Tax=Deinococcus radiophilus TaxID=32062 RepID=UPI003606C199
MTRPEAVPQAPVRRARSRRRTAALSAAALALLLAFMAAYAPALLGRWILTRVTEDVTAERIDGPLWNPVLQGTRVELPGITARAERLGVRLAGFDFGQKILYVSVDLKNAEVAVELAELLGQGEDAITTEEGWKVQLRQLTVSDTSLTVNGEGANVPDGTFKLTQEDGVVTATGQTENGALNAQLRLQETPQGTEYVTTFKGDARILRYYWEGVEEGTVSGVYVLGQGPVRGDIKLTDGRVQVPDAEWAEVTEITGSAIHRGDLIQVGLRGVGYGEPVTGRVNVNLAREEWKAELLASPQLAELGEALGTPGEGQLSGRAWARNTGPGWGGVTVGAEATSQGGSLAGLPFSGLGMDYRYLLAEGQDEPQINRWTLDADTTLLGEQRLSGVWNFGGAGRVDWQGELLDAPLDLNATIARELLDGEPADIATITGNGLGGPVDGRLALSGALVDLRLRPALSALSGDLAVTGRTGDLRVTGRGLNLAGFALDGQAQFSEAGTVARLTQPTGGSLRLDLDGDWRGQWQAQGLQGSGVTLSGQGGLDVNNTLLGGVLSVRSGLLEDPLSGPLRVNWGEEQGRWTASGQQLEWRGERLYASLNNLRVSNGVRLDGQLNASLGLDDLRGTLRGTGDGFQVTATGEGNRARWRGTLGDAGRPITLSGVTELSGDFATTLALDGAAVAADVQLEGSGVTFDLRTGGERAQGRIEGEQWDAQGRVNLGALRPVLRGVLGQDSPLADLSGTLNLNLAGLGGTARIEAQAAGAALAGTLRRAGGTVTTRPAAERRRGQRSGWIQRRRQRHPLSGSGRTRVSHAGPAGGVTGLNGQTLQARIFGDYDNLNAALSGRTGPLTLSGAELPAQTLALTGRLTPQPELSGRWGDLNLSYSGASGVLSAEGRQTLQFQGQAASVRGRVRWGAGWQGEADLVGTAEGGYAVTARGPWSRLRVTASHPDGLRAAGTVNAAQQSYDLTVSGRAEGFGVQGRVSGQELQPQGQLTLTDDQGAAPSSP